MQEVLVRLLVALAPAASVVVQRQPGWQSAANAAALGLAWGLLVYLLEKRELRKDAVAGVIAVVDSAAIAWTLSATGTSATLGALVLVPVVWAARCFQVNPVNVAPMAALSLVLGPYTSGAKDLPVPVLAQAGAVLIVGLLVGRPRVLFVETPVALDEDAVEAQPRLPEEPSLAPVVEDLKESFRSLREHARDLERRGRRDRTAMHLHESVLLGQEGGFAALAKGLSEAASVEGLVLFAPAEAGRKLVMAASMGQVPEVVSATRFDVPANASDSQVKSQIERKLDAWETGSGRPVTGVLLRSNSRIVGLVGLLDPNIESLSSARDRVEEVADVIGGLTLQIRDREENKRRLAEAETLYTVAAVTLGAESPVSVVARVAREIGAALRLDHFGVFLLEGAQANPMATEGVALDVMPEMSFAYGSGVQGWLKTGAPETVMADALDDERLPKNFAIKKRLGSLALIPVQFGEVPFGYVTCATTRVGGIDTAALETLRAVVAEMAQALARLENPLRDPEGLMTPAEFRVLCASSSGTLVHLEVLRKDELTSTFGRPAFELAVRRFATRARSRLPQGAGLTRRDEGDYVALLPGFDEETSRAWANDLVATGSMVPVTTPDGRLRIPLAIRSKVARIAAKSAT